MKKIYKLIGILDMFEVIPSVVYPVFEDNNEIKYLGEIDEKGISYIKFFPIKDDAMDKIKLLSSFKKVRLEIEKEKYCVGDEAIMSFTIDKDKLYIASLDNVLKLCNNYDGKNEKLKEELMKEKKDILERKATNELDLLCYNHLDKPISEKLKIDNKIIKIKKNSI